MILSNSARIEPLIVNNYDTWKIQMEALLRKSKTWVIVHGDKTKLVIIERNEQTVTAAMEWTTQDSDAKSDIILSISPSEFKQIKGCATSNDV